MKILHLIQINNWRYKIHFSKIEFFDLKVLIDINNMDNIMNIEKIRIDKWLAFGIPERDYSNIGSGYLTHKGFNAHIVSNKPYKIAPKKLIKSHNMKKTTLFTINED